MPDEIFADKIAKLPKWAQTLIESNVRQIENLQRELTKARSEFPDSNVVIGQGLSEDDHTLPPDSRITFKMGGDKWYRDITVHHENGWLCIHGGGSLNIRPHVTNLIYVKVEETR